MWFQNPTVDPKISTTKLLPEITRLKLEESSDSNKGVEQDKTSEWCFSVPKTRSDTIKSYHKNQRMLQISACHSIFFPTYSIQNELHTTDTCFQNSSGGEELSLIETFHALCAWSFQAQLIRCSANFSHSLPTASTLIVPRREKRPF